MRVPATSEIRQCIRIITMLTATHCSSDCEIGHPSVVPMLSFHRPFVSRVSFLFFVSSQTHYHNLVQEFAGSEYVTSCHMDCQVTSDDAVSGQQEVTFLYRVAEGSCPKSYGFNVARMAGLPDPVVREARLAAIRLEQKAMRRKELHRLIHQLTVSPIPVAAEQTELARSLCRRIKDLSLQLEQ